jgi:hypothetical protein
MRIFGKSIGGGRRSASRDAAITLAILSTVEDDHRVALINVSRRGARLAAPDLPGKGEDVIFRTEAVESFGRVVWSRNGQCGVLFEPPISATELAGLRQNIEMAA